MSVFRPKKKIRYRRNHHYPPRDKFPFWPLRPVPYPVPYPYYPDRPESPSSGTGSGPPADEPTLPAEKDSEFIRWVQSTLNMVMKLRLPVDGIMGPETRRALRKFQRRKGIAADGIVGPDTKNALIASRRRLSGRPSSDAKRQDQEWEERFLGPLSGWLINSPAKRANRKSKSYIKWVQNGLNKIMGLQLVVDGICGSKTRSAIRDFQRKNSLPADGIVSPATERALINAGAGRPPLANTTPKVSPFNTQHTGNTASLKNGIVKLANQEWERWKRGSIKESDPGIRKVLENYWRRGAGWLPNDNVWWSKHPWSAAFVSWVMRQAGAGSDFKYSAAHAVYTKAAKDNRLSRNQNLFKAYRISEVVPQPGDLVCKSRAGSGATYDNIRQGMKTHCDIVTAVEPGRITTIGGNVSNSVSRTYVKTDKNGYISKPGYFAVIKVG